MYGRVFFFVAAIMATVALAACANTVKGAGHDIQNSGKAISRAAN
ncbi:MAG TPA: entericidin A/B family lipoprotein [Hansschlegelia sp.]